MIPIHRIFFSAFLAAAAEVAKTFTTIIIKP